MKKLVTLACISAMALTAAATTVHEGNGMSGADAYSEVTFTCAKDGYSDQTAKAVYTMTAGDEGKMNVTTTFENLTADVFVGLVDPCYAFIEGIGEKSMTLADGKYTVSDWGTFTEGTTYTGWFKRMSSGEYYGGDLLFPFKFTYTTGGDTPTPAPNYTYAIHGNFTDPNWSSTDMTEADGLWSCTLTPTNASGEFGVKAMDGETQKEWWALTDVATLSEENATLTLVNGGTTNAKYELTAGQAYAFTFNPANGQLKVESVQELEPVTGNGVYYIMPAKGSADIPTTFYPWWQCTDLTKGTAQYGDNAEATTYTIGAPESIVNEAFSGGWLSTGFDVSPILSGDYDLVFSIKSTSAATTAVKLVATDGGDKGNETLFTFTNDGEWQTVRMNLKEKFPDLITSGATDGNVYVFSLVGGEGLKGGDTFTLTDVRFERVGYEPEPEPEPIAVPETLYLIGHVDGNGWDPSAPIEMTKAEKTFTVTATVDEAGDGVGYFAFCTAKSASKDDWNIGTRYGASTQDEELTVTDEGVTKEMAIDGSNYSYKVAVGRYDFTVTFTDEAVTLKVVKATEGVTDITAAGNGAAEYYNLQGVRVNVPAAGNIYIVRRGTTVTKELVK